MFRDEPAEKVRVFLSHCGSGLRLEGFEAFAARSDLESVSSYIPPFI
jgi:hypothetical protein